MIGGSATEHGDADSLRLTQLASIGFAVRATSPALLHAIRGCLHDLTMLAALLRPHAAPVFDDGGSAAKLAQRLQAIGAQLDLLGRNVTLLGAMSAWPRGEVEAVCSTASAIPDVVRLLQDEAARQRVRLAHDLGDMPPYVHAAEPALQQTLLACGAWTAQRAGESGSMRFFAHEDGPDAVFEFEASVDSEPSAHAEGGGDDVRLLAALAEAAGGRLATVPWLRVAFARADGRSTPD